MSESQPNQQQDRRDRAYVLMTAAHNEEAFLEKTIASVLSQTVLPQRWVIVSDNSSDRTDEIAKSYAQNHDFIRFLRINRTPGRNFGSKVRALRQGVKLLEGTHFEFIGNLDADVSVNPAYFEELMGYFERDPELGLGAGFIHEEHAGRFRSRRSNRIDSVPHAAQLVRRECYEELGGYAVLKHGGEDWYAQTCARKNGWRAEAIPGLPVFHHRHTGAGTDLLRAHYRLGQLDYSLGSDPLFEVITVRPTLSRPAVRFRRHGATDGLFHVLHPAGGKAGFRGVYRFSSRRTENEDLGAAWARPEVWPRRTRGAGRA